MNINLTPEIIALGLGIIGTIVSGAFVAGGLYSKIKRNSDDTEKLEKTLETTAKDFTDEMKEMSRKLERLIGRVSAVLKDNWADDLSAAASPRQLNNKGKKVLKDSAIEQVLEPLFDTIVDSVRSKDPANPYQAQEILFEVVETFKEDDGLREAIENGAFLSGHTPEEVLYVGALNIRDDVIEELGLQVGDIDKHDPTKEKAQQ